MNIVRKSYWLGALLAATCVFSACTSNDDANDENTVSSNYIVVSSKVSMSGNSQAATVDVTSNCHWKVSYDKGSWTDLIVTPTEGTGNTVVTIESSVNNTESDRVVVLNFSASLTSLIARIFLLTAEAVPFTANSANATPMSTNGCVYISSIFVISFLTRNTAASGYQTVVVPHPKLSVRQILICRLGQQKQRILPVPS